MTKNGKPRNAFIIEDVKKSLLRLKDLDVRQRAGRDKGDDWVLSKSDNKKWWAAALEDAGYRELQVARNFLLRGGNNLCATQFGHVQDF